MKITYFTRGGGGCDHYRVIQPLDEVGRQGLAQVRQIQRGDDIDTIQRGMGADVYVLPRPGEPHACGLAKDLKAHGKVVVEYDDDIFDISPFSPHYEEHGLEEVKITLPGGDVVPLWTDGKNIDLKRNRENLAVAKEAISAADLVTVTTDRLAERYRPYNKNIAVLPNLIDLERWHRLPLVRKTPQEIRMGWFGGSSHYEDWVLLSDVLPEVMSMNPWLTLVIMGTKFQGTLKKLPPERVEFHKWEPVQAYPYKAAILDLDFAVIPLRDTPFNRCKSPIKFLEMGALEVPSVMSYVPPYADVMTEANGVFVENNEPGAWVEGIRQLAEDRVARSRYGLEAWNYAQRHFDLKRNAHRWVDAYRELGVN